MSVTVEMNFDLRKINLDLTKELNIVGQMIREDHSKRLQRGEGVDGSKMARLKDATIERKGFNQILVDTGEMGNLVIDKATKSKQEVNIFPGRKKRRGKGKITNQELGGYHQRGGGNLPKREWFGITNKIEPKANKLIEDRIERELRRA